MFLDNIPQFILLTLVLIQFGKDCANHNKEVTKTENWVISFIGVIVLQLIFWWGGWYSNF